MQIIDGVKCIRKWLSRKESRPMWAATEFDPVHGDASLTISDGRYQIDLAAPYSYGKRHNLKSYRAELLVLVAMIQELTDDIQAKLEETKRS